jgi:hypothetical protein
VGRERHCLVHLLSGARASTGSRTGKLVFPLRFGPFCIVVSPFALAGWTIGLGGALGLTLMILGIRGVVRTLKKQSAMPRDPYDAIREWAAVRRNAYFQESYRDSRAFDPDELTLDEFVRGQLAIWWGEKTEDAVS